MKRALLLTTLLLTGCATATWQQDGKTTADFDNDKAECAAYGAQMANNMGLGFNPIFQVQQSQDCLRRKGWSSQ